MSLSIPYDPSLVLGNIISSVQLATVKKLADINATVQQSKDALTTLMNTSRSLKMTENELIGMGITPDQLQPFTTEMVGFDKAIADAANAYVKTVIDAGKSKLAIPPLSLLSSAPESPLDWSIAAVKELPLASNTFNLDAQYFSADEIDQGANSSMSAISKFVSASVDYFGDSFSSQATSSVTKQVATQYEKHDVEGTLVVVVTCTHKNVSIIEPAPLDGDKAVSAWNALHKDDQIDISKTSALVKAVEEAEKPESDLQLLSGVNYGSSFIGMVHVLKKMSTMTEQDMMSMASNVSAAMKASLYFSDASGGFGADEQMASDVKNLISSQTIASRISLVVMGVIPSIKSNQVKIGVKTFADNFDPAAMMGKLAEMANDTGDAGNSAAKSAEAARSGGKLVALQNSQIKSVVSALGTIDETSNNMLDIDSMMTAFEDYVNKCIAGTDVGVPINFYTKPLSKATVAKAWIKKYYPQYSKTTTDDIPASTPEPTPPHQLRAFASPNVTPIRSAALRAAPGWPVKSPLSVQEEKEHSNGKTVTSANLRHNGSGNRSSRVISPSTSTTVNDDDQ